MIRISSAEDADDEPLAVHAHDRRGRIASASRIGSVVASPQRVTFLYRASSLSSRPVVAGRRRTG
jgi:hypothetical protein